MKPRTEDLCAGQCVIVDGVESRVQIVMIAWLSFTALRDAIFMHPTVPECLISLFSNVLPISVPVAEREVLPA